jgi:toxin-antitoxin system PIN domain toxin
MIRLLDVNALVALGFSQHEHHDRVSRWVAGLPEKDSFATCSITELGFVRILNQVPQYRVPIRDACELISRLRKNRKRRFVFIPDDHGAAELPAWVKTGKRTTDGHLLELAKAHGAELATLDEGIPGAFQIP